MPLQTHRTGWRRIIGCLKLQVILRKKATNYMVLLRKMTYEDQASHDSMLPCSMLHNCRWYACVCSCVSVRAQTYVCVCLWLPVCRCTDMFNVLWVCHSPSHALIPPHTHSILHTHTLPHTPILFLVCMRVFVGARVSVCTCGVWMYRLELCVYV